MNEKLLPCPFCGGEAGVKGIRDGVQVSCKGHPGTPCFAKGPAVFHGPKGWEACALEAIAAWNTRANPDADALAEVLEEALELLGDCEAAYPLRWQNALTAYRANGAS